MESVIMEKNKRQSFVDYFLILSIIALTGFEFFFRAIELFFYIIGPISCIVFIHRKRKFTVQFVLFLLMLIAWSSVQIMLGYSTVSALIHFNIRFIIYYLVVASVGNNFGRIFVNIVTCISAISIVMYASINLFPGIYKFLYAISLGISPLGGGIDAELTSNPGHSLIIFFLPTVHTIRNSGPFWEPGMFAVFINIALALNVIRTCKLADNKNIILVIASLTTLSTTSYIATISILLYFYLVINRNARSIIGILVIGICSVYFLESDFGYEKIKSNSENTAAYSRFGAINYHVSIIKEYPISGRGFQSGEEDNKMEVSPNGLTNLIVFFGIPFSVYLYLLLLKSSFRFAGCFSGNRKLAANAILIYLIFLIVAFSQDVTTRHFYYILMMYPLVNRPVKIKKRLINESCHIV